MVEAFDGLTQATFELGGGMGVRTKELCGQPTAGQRGVRSCTAVAMRVTSRTHAKNQERVERKARKGADVWIRGRITDPILYNHYTHNMYDHVL